MTDYIRPAGPGRKPSLAEFVGHPGVWVLCGPGVGANVLAARLQPMYDIALHVALPGGYVRLDDIRDDVDWIAIGDGGNQVEVIPAGDGMVVPADDHCKRAKALFDSSVMAGDALAEALIKHDVMTDEQRSLLGRYLHARGLSAVAARHE